MRGSFLVLALIAGAAFPQTPKPPAQEQPAEGETQQPFRVQVKEVIVPVTVTDEKGRFVSNLEQKDFRIFDQGNEQRIIFFTREHKQPVVVGFLIDLSNSSRLHWKKFQEAALELVWALLPGDPKYSGFLVTYSNDAELAVNTTTDSEKIVDRIRKVKPGGGAALYDAIYLACTRRDLVKGEPIEPRRVLIVVGDGNDNASKKSIDEVVEIAQRNLVTIYGVSTVAFGFTSEGEKNLTRLAEETGGRVEYPLQGLYSDVSGYLSTPSDEGNYALKVGTGGYASELAKGLFRAIANVTGEVTTQYILRYVPALTDDPRHFRGIRVEVPSLPNVKVRARRGYYPYAP
jgi:VWFA-related protein